ncbi:MAG TPA: glutamate--tRNA ligase, partial [Rhizobiales bacterium]|nr:glutamate--tRNA ligase [Hyphomicrobiales bacterium]
MSGNVVTRFPPSPTGFLHIGGARTALFNWLYAKANNGKMVLRIEDTDRERSTQEAVDAIIEGLQWLGLDWSGDPVSQAARADRHVEVARLLQEKGLAYNCYCTREELQEMREKARAEGRPMRYDGTWRDRPQSDAPEGVEPVLRFRSQQDGQTVVHDQVMGDVTFDNSELDDLILLRSDGSPT